MILPNLNNIACGEPMTSRALESTVRVFLVESTQHCARPNQPLGFILPEYFAYAYIMGYVLELGNVYERNVVYVVHNVERKQRVLFPLDGRTFNVS